MQTFLPDREFAKAAKQIIAAIVLRYWQKMGLDRMPRNQLHLVKE